MYYDMNSSEFFKIVNGGYKNIEEIEKTLEENINKPFFKNQHSELYVNIAVKKMKKMLDIIRKHKEASTAEFKLKDLSEFKEKMYEISGGVEGITIDICTYDGVIVEYKDDDEEEIEMIIPDCEYETLFFVRAELLSVEEYAAAHNVSIELIKKLAEDDELIVFIDDNDKEGISEMEDLPILDENGNVVVYRRGGFSL